MPKRRTRTGTVLALLALAAAAARLPLGAQATTGTIRGRVTHQATGMPVGNAQVGVQGTRLGTLSGNDGTFTIAGVPAGRHSLRVRMIGYSPADREVAVVAGQPVSVEIGLTPSAVALDEVVVTGTAGNARKREVGNSIASVRTSDAPEAMTNVSNLLAGRVAGASVMQSAGVIGAGSSIRLRGNTSVALSNQPLIYVDGVRTRSDEYPKNVPPSGSSLRSSHVNASPLNDINPEDIERIEILKGAAASTLYGTEAAAGVIQIFTKRGAAGKAQWTAQINQGFAKEMPFAPDVADPADTLPIYGTVGATTPKQSPRSAKYLYMDPWLRTGARQGYALSVSGGAPSLRYFSSGNYEDNKGVLPNDHEKRYTVRGNFNYTPFQSLTLEWTSGYTNDQFRQTPAGNNAHGLTLNAFRRDRNYFSTANVDTISTLLNYDLRTFIDRLTLGGTATFTPLASFTHRVTVGLDRAAVENRNLRPFNAFRGVEQGIISDQQWVNRTVNADYVGNWDWGVREDLKSTFSWGGQSAQSDVRDLSAYSEGFPGPGEPTVSSGAQKLGFESRQRVITAGFFLQELLGYKDRYFLTVGVRVDGNSAFGRDFGLQRYPKVSASYVLSEEPFWNRSWGTLKLRAAYGEAGRAPGAFDAVRTWDAIGWGGLTALRPRNLGNPTLGPERTREVELGFESSTLGGRLTADFTYFHARTSDALLRVRQAPSTGGWDDQLENTGTLQKKGIELALNGTLLDLARFGWTAGLAVATNQSKVLSLGGAPPFSLGSFGWIIEGQPVAVVRGRLIRNANAVGAVPDTVSNYLFGPSQPTRIISGNTAVRFGRGFELSARGEYQGGHFLDEDASFQGLSRAVRWPTCFGAYDKIAAGQQAQLTVREALICNSRNVRQDMFIYPADFFKIRDVSLRVPVGALLPNTRNAQLVLSAANFYTWKKKEFAIFDPEQAGNDGFNAAVRYISEHIPSPATFTAQLRVTF